jgi:hypothetical protein
MNVGNIYNYHSVGCSCSDNISKGEKFTFSVFEQLQLNFTTQLSKREQKWCQNYRYDFYFEYNNEPYICEVNGLQHYEENTNFEMSLEEQVENDRLKKELAIFNGIKQNNYIILDYRDGNLNILKQNILESTLSKIFDLNIINWNKCLEYTCSNLVKVACEHKKNNPNFTTTEIGQLMGGYCRTTIQKWLQYGNELNWCNYDKEKETIKNYENSVNRNKINYSKPVEIFKNNTSLGVFLSAPELERKSMELFGIRLINSNIGLVCKGRQKHHKGYTFKYISKEEYEKRKLQEELNKVI